MKRLFFVFLFVCGFCAPLFSHDCISLEAVWRLVMENHEDVKALYLNNYQSQLNVRETLQRFLPQVGASVSLTFSNPSKEVKGSRFVPRSFRAGSLTVNQSLLDLRVRPSYKGAKWSKEATLHQSKHEIYEILYLASEAYLTVLQSEELLNVAENQVNLAQEQYAVTRDRYESGEVPVTDLLRSEEEMNRARRTYLDVKSEVHIYKEHLSNMIGCDVCGLCLLHPGLDYYCDKDLDFLIEEAFQRRQDLKSITSSIEAAKCLITALRRTNWPKLDFTGEYTLASPETLSYQNNSWSAALWLTMPIFDGGINSTKVKSAEAELAKQQLLYARMCKDIKLMIKSTFFELGSAEENFALLKNELTLAQESYSILLERYKKGQTSNIDLLDALNAYIQAQANLSNAQFNLILLSLKIKKETGFFEELLENEGVLIS